MWRAAVEEGNAQAVVAWLDKGGGVDARCAGYEGETLLMAAALGGQEVLMRMLLQRGAGVNLQASFGGTALMGAARLGRTATVQALLDASGRVALRAALARAEALVEDFSELLFDAMVAGYARLQELDRQLAEESRAEAKTRHVEEHALRFEVRLDTHQ